MLLNKYLAEFLGSLFFTYMLLATQNPIVCSIAFILIYMLIHPISGCVLFPNIAIVYASIDKLPIGDLLPYVISQVLGALVSLEIYKRYKI